MSAFEESNRDGGMERLLASAMRGRPEAVWGGSGDLAAAAMERVRMREVRAARMQRIGRWVRWSSVAAAVMLVIVMVAAVWWEGRLEDSAAVDQTVAQSSDSGSGGVSQMEYAGVVLLLMVAGGMLVKGVLSGERGLEWERVVCLGEVGGGESR